MQLETCGVFKYYKEYGPILTIFSIGLENRQFFRLHSFGIFQGLKIIMIVTIINNNNLSVHETQH